MAPARGPPSLADVRAEAEGDARRDAHNLLRGLDELGQLAVEQPFARFATGFLRDALELVLGLVWQHDALALIRQPADGACRGLITDKLSEALYIDIMRAEGTVDVCTLSAVPQQAYF